MSLQTTNDAPTHLALVGEGDLSHGAVARRISRMLGRDGIEVTLRVIEEPARGWEAMAVRGVPRLGDVDLQPLRWRLRFSWRARRAFAALADADVGLINTQSCALLSKKWMRTTPTILSVDITGRQFSQLEYWRPRGRLAGVNDRPLERLERGAFECAAKIVAWSDWTARSLREDYGIDGDKVVVMHFGVDVERLAPSAGDRRPGPMRALFVGNGARRKGFDVLVQAVSALDEDVELHVVTNDDVASRPGMVVHRGVLPESVELRACFNDADVFVLPTRADAVPWAVVEALASGLPVVASDVGAIPELVGDAGILVPPGDSAAVAAALRRLADDEGLRRQFGTRSRDRATAHYDSAKQSKLLADLVRSLHPRAA